MIPEDFDPDAAGVANGNYFGLPFTPEQCALVLVSVPWDVTASYGGGASFAPDAIIEASLQVDLYDAHNPGGWRRGIGTAGIDYSIQDRSALLRPEAKRVMAHLEHGGDHTSDTSRRRVARINEASALLDGEVYSECARWIAAGKIVGLIGGDHSTPLGAIRAAAEKYPGMGVLHIDAHADLRERYEGFEHSHASIMYNVMTGVEGIGALVQAGLRDVSEGETGFAAGDPRIVQFFDRDLQGELFRGENWHSLCERMVAKLPGEVYISFDIDGLSPDLCPHTGTPVPGGFSFDQAVYLTDAVARSGRRIVGFDLTEVAPGKEGQWDANVGARMLYKLCNIALRTLP
jgi:agmatinase